MGRMGRWYSWGLGVGQGRDRVGVVGVGSLTKPSSV
jgi:hypothetical protein